MVQIIFISILVVMAALAAVVTAIFAVGGLQLSRKTSAGILQYFYYPILAGNAIGIIYSGRDFEATTFDPTVSGSPVAIWAIRLTSLFTLMACADQLVRYFKDRPKIELARALLALAFVGFWVTNSIIPAVFSAHPDNLSLSWMYTLVLGISLLCMGEASATRGVEMCRNALVIFCLVSLLFIPILPGVVLDWNYTQGLVGAKLPRLAGLAPHAIVLATNAAIAMWCLMITPLQTKWINRVAWFICAVTLMLAQSKSIWITFLVGTPIIFSYRRKAPLLGKKSIGEVNVLYGLFVMAGIIGVVGVAYYFVGGGGIDKLVDFSYTKEGAAITSLTGRDQIWEIALREWRSSPTFGYGLSIFDFDYRKQIGLMNATHGHNEIIDTLGRTGTVGAIGVTVYLVLLVWAGFKYARVTGGLSLTLAMAMLFRSISEPSLTVSSIGISEINHYLLLTVIAMGIARTRALAKVNAGARHAPAPGQRGLQTAGGLR